MTQNATDWIALFEEDDVPFILATLLRCGQLLRKTHETENEDKLSKRLRLLIRRDSQFRDSGIVLDREVEVFDDSSDSEDPIGILDFRFLGHGERRGPDWYFAVEAKRMHVSFPSGWKSLVSEYVTNHQGMMCFITGRYARGLGCGGMLGYVFDGDVDSARAAVAKSVEANSTLLTNTPHCTLTVSNILPASKEIGESVHFLESGRFVIYHVFLPV